MKHSSLKRALAAALAALSMLIAPAAAGVVEVNGTPLSQAEGWLDSGRSYITLGALCRESRGYTLRWDGSAALVEGEGLQLRARPGEQYIEVNGRALYLPQGVTGAAERCALPLRLLEQAMGGQVSWDPQRETASLDLTRARAQQADYPSEDLYWLSRIISAESRGEPLEGQIAVGNVVLNRVKSKQYPNTIREVIFDRKDGVQFEPVSNGTVYQSPTPTSLLAAKLALEGADVVGESLFFFAPALSPGTWIVNNCTYYTTIGCHRFYLE